MLHVDPRPSEKHTRITKYYCSILIPALREVARRHGYALTVHGSQERDIDLVAVPWTDNATDARALVSAIFDACHAIIGSVIWPHAPAGEGVLEASSGSLEKPVCKCHGRLAWCIFLGEDQYIDLSVMPRMRSHFRRTR